MDHQATAARLLSAWHGATLPLLDTAQRPPTEPDAYRIQQLLMAQLGPIGGWKVGAPGPHAPPNCAPMPLSGLHHAPAALARAAFPAPEIESEIAFVLAADLPPRATPYSRAEVEAAIATCHPGIELVQSRFTDEASVDPLTNLADLIRHGAYILGPPIPNWHTIDFAALPVIQTIDGSPMHRTGNPAGDMIRLIQWLANTGAAWAGGPRAGQVITCGSWTGKTPAGTLATAAFAGAEPVQLRLA